MFRLGGKYQHFIHGDSCGCSNPMLQQVSRRLDRLSRRHFLAGAAATAAATMIADRSFAQSPKILLTRARLFDGKADTLKSGVQVLVEGNRIAAVDTTNSAPPEGATVIDCGDRVLMPGLIDAHWHAVYAAVPLPVLLEGDLG
ncbi:amidohydrolase family protein, partial [Brucella anthropi]